MTEAERNFASDMVIILHKLLCERYQKSHFAVELNVYEEKENGEVFCFGKCTSAYDINRMKRKMFEDIY